MIPTADDAWPLSLEPSDEWAGDEWLNDTPSGHSNHLNLGGKLSAKEYQVADLGWLERYREVLRGDRAWDDPELSAASETLVLNTPRVHDRRPARVAPFSIPRTLLSDVAEDYIPDAGMLAADRFLGPWADVKPPREALHAVAGNLAFLPLLDYGGTARERWVGSVRPRPAIELRRAVHAAARAPATLYAPQPDGTWTPLLPLGEHYTPQGPVQAEVALLSGPAEVIVARAYPCEDGQWRAACALGFGERPPLERLMERLDLEMLRLRRHERRSTWEDLLRRRPEVLYRFCASYCWWILEERCAG